MLVLLAPSGASAAVHLDPIGSFDAPLYVTSLPNNADRLLVVEQGGTIQLVDHGVARLFLDLKTPRLVAAGGERGMLSVAPAPNYAATHDLYVSFTRPDGALEVDEFTVDGDSAPVSTRRPLLAVPHPNAANHNAGQLQFGPDGYLYISTGDGGGAGDLDGNAQNPNSLSGKILRIDPHPSGTQPYTVPPGNPSVGAIHPEIWAYGFRNPWRFSFDRLTGALLIGDVGQGQREEVDYRTQPDPARGENFGWNCREGLIPYSEPGTACNGLPASAFVNPIYDYSHDGGGCAIVGGYVVRDPSLGDLYGRYLFTDNCDGTIRSLVPGQPFATDPRSEGLSVSGPSSFGEDSCGRVYVAALGGGGTVSRLEGDAPASCAAPGGGGGGGGRTPPRCGGEPATRVAGAGRAIKGSSGDDVIVADSRDNRIRSGAGDDVICALGGRDRIRAGRGDDRIRGGHGKDTCVGGRGEDRTRSC